MFDRPTAQASHATSATSPKEHLFCPTWSFQLINTGESGCGIFVPRWGRTAMLQRWNVREDVIGALFISPKGLFYVKRERNLWCGQYSTSAPFNRIYIISNRSHYHLIHLYRNYNHDKSQVLEYKTPNLTECLGASVDKLLPEAILAVLSTKGFFRRMQREKPHVLRTPCHSVVKNWTGWSITVIPRGTHSWIMYLMISTLSG